MAPQTSTLQPMPFIDPILTALYVAAVVYGVSVVVRAISEGTRLEAQNANLKAELSAAKREITELRANQTTTCP